MWTLLTAAFAAEHVLAVAPFAANTGDAELAPFVAGLSDMVTTDVGESADVDLVERRQLNAILDELKLQHSNWADPTSAVKLGRGVGATAVIVGSLSESRGRVRLDARVVDVESGRVSEAVEVEGSVEDVFHLERQLSLRVLESLGASITPEHRKRLGALAPVPNVVGQGFDDGGPSLTITRMSPGIVEPPGILWIDGVAFEKLARRVPQTVRVKPGPHEVAIQALLPFGGKAPPKSGAFAMFDGYWCWGVVEVPDSGLNVTTAELCQQLQPGLSAYGSVIGDGGILQVSHGSDAGFGIDDRGAMGSFVVVPPGMHTLVGFIEVPAPVDPNGPPPIGKPTQRQEVCRQPITVKHGTVALVTVSPTGCALTEFPL
ncbi:MAG: hypothetical protein H6737_18660 [Alphaproteobacteria bacterium]|nr:hypothetical protein [Alphaproteobacteria bacterium]